MKISTFTATISLTAALWFLSAPMLTGCGAKVSDSNTSSVKNSGFSEGGDSASVPMDEIREAVVEIIGENYWPDKQLTGEELETETGIKAEMYEDFLAEKQNVETDIDIMIVLKASPDYLSVIETLLNDYREALMVKYKDRPQELGKVEASRIEIIDSYICYVQLGADTRQAMEKGAEQVLAQCQQENERAVDMIEKTIFNAKM